MRAWFRTIRARLFAWYSLVLVAVIMLFVASFAVYVSWLLRDRAARTSGQLTQAISSRIDSEIATMNEVSVNVAFSAATGDAFRRYFAEDDAVERDSLRRLLSDLLFAFIGPMQPVSQLTLYDLEGRSVGVGFSYRSGDAPVPQPWFAEAFARRGARLLTVPFADPAARAGELSLSLCRLYFDRSSMRIGYIEVRQRYDEVFRAAAEAAVPAEARDVYVFDEAGDVLFPASEHGRPEAARYRSAVDAGPRDGRTVSLRNPATGEHDLIGHAVSDLTGWTVVAVESQRVLLAPVARFTSVVCLAGVLVLLATLAGSFLLARRLTLPIRGIYESVRALSLAELPADFAVDSGIDELDSLAISFREMCDRLRASVGDLVHARTEEMRARMLALQSQMNPHFLHNTISTISVLAEDGMSREIVALCEDLSGMLRYISSSEDAGVPLGAEIEHTGRFLALMARRYEGQILSTIDVADGLRDLRVPKLSVQPLVENSLRHGIDVPPPWRIAIAASREDARWRVTVRDHGGGFPEEVLASIRSRMAAFDESGAMPSVHVQGMGILSIFLRLRLLYGDGASFEVGNAPDGGALVAFGAPG